jgi:hypothetical protein
MDTNVAEHQKRDQESNSIAIKVLKESSTQE